MLVGKVEARARLTVVLSAGDHDSMGPSGVLDQSLAAITFPIWPCPTSIRVTSTWSVERRWGGVGRRGSGEWVTDRLRVSTVGRTVPLIADQPGNSTVKSRPSPSGILKYGAGGDPGQGGPLGTLDFVEQSRHPNCHNGLQERDSIGRQRPRRHVHAPPSHRRNSLYRSVRGPCGRPGSAQGAGEEGSQARGRGEEHGRHR